MSTADSSVMELQSCRNTTLYSMVERLFNYSKQISLR